MRPSFYRCPNYSNCLLGYRGDDIEVTEAMGLLCPECGTQLVPKARPRTALIPALINWATIAILATAAWFAWPHVVRTWKIITSPPQDSPPAAVPAKKPAP